MTRLYEDLADVYDAIYSFKDYRAEARRVAALARRTKRTAGRTLLDVGCGTGAHIAHLQRSFDCVGIDASAEMLRVARRNAPGVRFVRGDMRTVRLEREFDVVVSLFSAIGYMRTLRDLQRAADTLAAHARRGGAVIVEPWLTPSTFAPRTSVLSADRPDLKAARVGRSVRKGRTSILEMQYLLARPGKPVRHVADRHALGLFETDELLAAFDRAGLRTKFLRHGLMPGRGLLVGRKP